MITTREEEEEEVITRKEIFDYSAKNCFEFRD